MKGAALPRAIPGEYRNASAASNESKKDFDRIGMPEDPLPACKSVIVHRTKKEEGNEGHDSQERGQNKKVSVLLHGLEIVCHSIVPHVIIADRAIASEQNGALSNAPLPVS